ncbi:EF-Tu/IF-2/RF-3 family GTPase [Streptomyces sp. NPDC059037]|uniref:EF-Tu C-terminal domain-related protein n=1 Tax=Streptomyces sp. NPDC059037 TaxID=3346710 RepID=UPI003688B71B
MAASVVVFRNPSRAKTGPDGKPLYGQTVTTVLDPIFTAEEIRALGAALARHRRGSNQGPHGRVYPLSRRVFGLCGLHYTGAEISTCSVRFYRCTGKNESQTKSGGCRCSRIDANVLEPCVWREVRELLSDPDRLRAMADDWAAQTIDSTEDQTGRLASLDKKIEEQNGAIDLTMSVAAKQVARRRLPQVDAEAAVERALKPLHEELAELEKLRAEVIAWLRDAETVDQRIRDLQALAELARTRLVEMSPTEQAEVLALLRVRVTITGSVPRTRTGDCSVTSWFRDRSRRVPVLTDDGWEAVEPILTAAHRYRRTDRLPERDVVEAVLNKARTGSPWPRDKGYKSRFHRWVKTGVWEAVMARLADEDSTPVPDARPLPPLRIEGRIDPRLLLRAAEEPEMTVPTGRGTVVTGAVERGTVRIGDRVEVLGAETETVVTGLETFGKPMESAQAGDNVALLLRGVPRDAVRRGHVVAAPGSVSPSRRFTAQVYVLSTREGGRSTPIATGYRPQFYLRTADVVGDVDLGDAAVARPGDTVTMTVELGRDMPLETGLGFAIREGGRTVGAGTVTEVG